MPSDYSDKKGPENPNGYRCHEYNSKYHLRNECPVRKTNLAEKGRGGDSGSSGSSSPKGGEQRNFDWKFIYLAENNATITVNGLEYFD